MKHLHRQRKSRRILIGASVILGVCIAYTLMSVFHWQSLADKSHSQIEKAKVLAARSLDASLKRNDRRTAIRAIDQLNNQYAALCHSNFWYKWQTVVISSAHNSEQDCRERQTKLIALATAARAVETELRGEDTVNEILSSLKIDAKQLTEKDWDTKAINGVKSASKALHGLKPSKETQIVIKEAIARTDALKTRWSVLSAANKKQDKTAYLAALEALDQAYTELNAISEVADKELTPHLNGLQKSSRAL